MELLTFTFFPRSATILLVVWSANSDGALTSKASSNVNLLNDDTYQQWDCATVIMSAFGQIDQGVHKEIFDLLNKESVSGVHSGRTSL